MHPTQQATTPEVSSEGWLLYRRHEAQLRRLAALYASTEPRLAGWQAEDVMHEFALKLSRRKLPVRVEDEGKYVRAAFRNLLRDWSRARTREQSALRQFAQEHPGSRSSEQEQSLDPSLTEVIVTIPQPQGTAAALYLGLDGRQRSIRAIAEELKMSQAAARRAVIDGLLWASVSLGHTGALTHRQLEAVRLVLVEGLNPADAAWRMEVEENEITSALSQARMVVGQAFRARQSNHQEPSKVGP